MDDLISRQAAIDALKRKQDNGKGDISRFYNTIIQHDIEAISQLPSAQPEPHWIPVTERLPEKDGRYLVTNSRIGAWIIDVDLFLIGNNRWRDNQGVTAWMPLPEPYKGETE